jgi:8-oxo-dGTP diphosphatase
MLEQKEGNSLIPTTSVDCVIFGFDDSELKILVYERGMHDEPGYERWGLPGGFVRMDEDLDQAAVRILNAVAGLKDVFMEQVRTFGNVNRYPGSRVITTAYYALINPSKHKLSLGKEAKQARWVSIEVLPPLVFDHLEIVEAALKVLKRRVRHEPVGFELLPDKFTLTFLQRLYESILGSELDTRNFRKKLLKMGLLIKLNEKQKGVPHRAANLYKFDNQVYTDLKEKGFVFDL